MDELDKIFYKEDLKEKLKDARSKLAQLQHNNTSTQKQITTANCALRLYEQQLNRAK
jgi:hypothetical protein